jgi:hypothetical protein
MTTTLQDYLAVVRNLTRDFGTPFDVNFAPRVGSQLRLPHPMVDPDSVVVVNNTTGLEVPQANWAVNSHQGVLRLSSAASFTDGISLTGIYYQWFLDEDLYFFIDMIIKEHMHHRGMLNESGIHGAEVEVIGIGALCLALQSLLTELSTDLDVVSPEGVNIPAHQRYSQVQQLLSYWQAKYDEKAAMLNVGLKRMETFDLRRVSKQTERLVPIYRPRELDHYTPPIRVRPPIDPIADSGLDDEADAWIEEHGSEGDMGFIDVGATFFGTGGI